MALIPLRRPRKLPFRRQMTRASVALIHRQNQAGGAELLFIQRAHRDGDPWSGDMAFPGGRLQAEDRGPFAAAIRETLEETGLDLSVYGRFERRLSDLITRHHNRWRPMVVTPYVFEWSGPDNFTQNHEVQTVVWIPLAHLGAPENQSVRPWPTRFGTLRMACCRYQGHCIWGLSYQMLQEYLKHRSAISKP
ncbi:NUDIX hydrolase [Marinobacter sp.]|uniref:NUDIX hydrolase n=1 Tax=Marinobacter sp. TaxID=50741 RepID=UPI00384FF7F4